MQLLQRTAAGLVVILDYEPEAGPPKATLVCTCDGATEATEVPVEKMVDAFHHPMCYLLNAQVNRLFPRHTPED